MTDRAAIVTGAASGIGRALTERLTGAGVAVLAVDVDRDGVAAVADATGCLPQVVDLGSAEANRDLVSHAVRELGGLDMVFLNAGLLDRDPGTPFTGIGDLDLDRYARMRSVNLDAVVYGSLAAADAMAGLGGGAIVATASVAGLVGYPPNPLYSATKAGVVGLVLALGPTLADQGVRLNAICPGGVATPMVGMAPADADRVETLLSPADLAEEMVRTAEGDAAGVAFTVVAGRSPRRQVHPIAPVPGFG